MKASYKKLWKLLVDKEMSKVIYIKSSTAEMTPDANSIETQGSRRGVDSH